MAFSKRARAHRKTAVDSTLWWDYRPGQRVMTKEGIPGVVDDVWDGPQPGNETYLVTLANGFGGGEYASRELSPMGKTGAKAWSDYPELGRILHERPSPELEVRALSDADTSDDQMAAAEAKAVGDDPANPGGQEPWYKSAKLAATDRSGTLSGTDLRDHFRRDHSGFMSLDKALRGQTVEDVHDREHDHVPSTQLGHSHEGDRINYDPGRTSVKVTGSEGEAVISYDPASDRLAVTQDGQAIWSTGALVVKAGIGDWLLDHLTPASPLPGGPGGMTSFDWCRFRKDRHCMYSKNLDEAATRETGYQVWIPHDRGICPRDKWADQETCPISEAGPHSGAPNAMPEATESFEEGGQRVAAYRDPFDAAYDLGFHLTATWSDVRAKAKRLRKDGKVRIISSDGVNVAAEVRGDHNLYQTKLVRMGKEVSYWECGCPWAAYSWGRTRQWRKFEGRMCSHALATLYQAQSDQMFGGEVQTRVETPTWRQDSTVPVLPPSNYPKPKGASKAAKLATIDPFPAKVQGVPVTVFDVGADGFSQTDRGEVATIDLEYPLYHPSAGLDFDPGHESKLAGYDEAQHPRDSQGRWTQADFEGAARNVNRQAWADEKDLTPVLRDIAKQTGGKFNGLDFRFKGQKHLGEGTYSPFDAGRSAQKIRGISTRTGLDPWAAAKGLGDPLRYTLQFPDKDYTEGVLRTVAALKKAGYRPVRTGPSGDFSAMGDKADAEDFDNYWLSHSVYNGTNVGFRTPEGGRWELQFHTPESFANKEKTHNDLEIAQDRSGKYTPEERKAAWDRMLEVTKGTPMPPGVMELGDLTRHRFGGGKDKVPSLRGIGAANDTHYFLMHYALPDIPTTLYRQRDGIYFEYWNGSDWVEDPELMRHMVVGGTDHDEISPEDARSFMAGSLPPVTGGILTDMWHELSSTPRPACHTCGHTAWDHDTPSGHCIGILYNGMHCPCNHYIPGTIDDMDKLGPASTPEPLNPNPQYAMATKTAMGPRDTPASAYGMRYSSANSARPSVQAAKSWRGWDQVPVSQVPTSDLEATEGMLSSGSINKHYADMRPGYYPQILADDDGKNYVIDGHHRVGMHAKRGDSTMPAKVIHAADLPRDAEGRFTTKTAATYIHYSKSQHQPGDILISTKAKGLVSPWQKKNDHYWDNYGNNDRDQRFSEPLPGYDMGQVHFIDGDVVPRSHRSGLVDMLGHSYAYEVEPIGPVTEDPNWLGGYRSPEAKVIRQVEAALEVPVSVDHPPVSAIPDPFAFHDLTPAFFDAYLVAKDQAEQQAEQKESHKDHKTHHHHDDGGIHYRPLKPEDYHKHLHEEQEAWNQIIPMKFKGELDEEVADIGDDPIHIDQPAAVRMQYARDAVDAERAMMDRDRQGPTAAKVAVSEGQIVITVSRKKYMIKPWSVTLAHAGGVQTLGADSEDDGVAQAEAHFGPLDWQTLPSGDLRATVTRSVAATLHDVPEPALPSTDGADDDAGGLLDTDDAPSKSDPQGMGPDPATGTMGDEFFTRDDPLADRKSASTGREWLMRDSTGPSDSDIAKAARAHLAQAEFSVAEQMELMHEGDGESKAANLDRLDLEGTHYAEMEELLQKAEDEGEWVLFL